MPSPVSDPQPAVRSSWDAVAAPYATRVRDELAGRPFELDVLARFAGSVLANPAPLPVVDVGCGPGYVSAHLSTLGVPVHGIDLSPGMVAEARAAYPHLTFEVGSMLALDLPDASVSGALLWYSTVNVPTDLLPRAFAELHRVLAPGGQAVVAFQVGEDVLHVTEYEGHDIDLTFHRRQPDAMAALLADAGLPVHTTLVRDPITTGHFPERTRQAFLLASRPTTEG